jgi:hypothetical protein
VSFRFSLFDIINQFIKTSPTPQEDTRKTQPKCHKALYEVKTSFSAPPFRARVVPYAFGVHILVRRTNNSLVNDQGESCMIEMFPATLTYVVQAHLQSTTYVPTPELQYVGASRSMINGIIAPYTIPTTLKHSILSRASNFFCGAVIFSSLGQMWTTKPPLMDPEPMVRSPNCSQDASRPMETRSWNPRKDS